MEMRSYFRERHWGSPGKAQVRDELESGELPD